MTGGPSNDETLSSQNLDDNSPMTSLNSSSQHSQAPKIENLSHNDLSTQNLDELMDHENLAIATKLISSSEHSQALKTDVKLYNMATQTNATKVNKSTGFPSKHDDNDQSKE